MCLFVCSAYIYVWRELWFGGLSFFIYFKMLLFYKRKFLVTKWLKEFHGSFHRTWLLCCWLEREGVSHLGSSETSTVLMDWCCLLAFFVILIINKPIHPVLEKSLKNKVFFLLTWTFLCRGRLGHQSDASPLNSSSLPEGLAGCSGNIISYGLRFQSSPVNFEFCQNNT